MLRSLCNRVFFSAWMCFVSGFVGHVSALSGQSPLATSARVAAEPRVTIHADHVRLSEALRTIGQRAQVRIGYSPLLVPADRVVSVHADNVPVSEAIRRALAGTDVRISRTEDGSLLLFKASDGVEQGVVQGHITDAKTRQSVHGAIITLDRATTGVTSDEGGFYRLIGVTPGTHAVIIKRLGYGHVARQIIVNDETLTLDVALEPSVNTLDQVVVTGTVIPTELKAVPNAITVITAKDIEQRGITKIDQLFRGDVPGLFAQNRGSGVLLDEVTMYSRGATALSGNSAGVSSTFLTNPIKTYVDGVELADPKYLNQIDPKSIERIEILTGPQASTIYGSNAINGVMQIFTKRGTSTTPQLTLDLLSGWVENNFSNARTPQHDYSAQLSGIEGQLSYNAGGSWNYVGPWTPAKQTTRTSAFGGTRLELPTRAGRVTADLTLRRSIMRNVQRGHLEQTTTRDRESGLYVNVSASGLVQPATYTLAGQTLGLQLSYTPTSWWSHEFGWGQDISDMEQRGAVPGYRLISDTTLFLYQSHADRRSLHYATTTHLPITSVAQLMITAGADAWQNLASYVQVTPQTLTGSLTGSTFIGRQPGHNTGGFLQTQFNVIDRLFLTYGLRAEWNPNYGADAQPNLAPRYGVAFTQDVGPLTVKLRGSYGRSTRPPQPGLKATQTIADYYNSFTFWSSFSARFLPYYGNVFDYYLANPTLAPEHQQGSEGGIELYLGTRGSLVITRYNQTVDGLIASPAVDSVRTLVPCPISQCNANNRDVDGYGYYRQLRYLNIGSIRNQGWELQGNMNVGPLTTRGTYSWTKSRTLGVNPQYRTYFANQSQYQPGATFRYLPEHTWALGVTYTGAVSNVTLNMTGIGRVMNSQNDFYLQNLSGNIRLPQRQFNVSNIGGYVNFNSRYALADVMVSHRLASTSEAVLQIQNLMNHYINDYYAPYATLGRQIKAGLKLRTP